MALKVLREKLGKSEFFKNAAKLTAGTVLAQIISFLASPILSRLYTPSDFGTFALYNSIIAVLAIIATARYELAIVIAKNILHALNLSALSFCFLVLTTAITLIAIFVLHDELKAILAGNDFGVVLYLMPVTLFFFGLYQILSYWINRNKGFQEIAKSKVAQTVSNSSVAIGLGFFWPNSLGMILANLIGIITSFIFLSYKNIMPLLAQRRLIKPKAIKLVARKYSDFPAFSLPNGFLDTFSSQAPIFFITMLYSSAIAGHYSFAYRIASIPVTIIGASIGQVFYQKFSELYSSGGDCRGFLFKTWISLFALALVPCLFLLLFGPSAFSIIFGSQWLEAGKISQYLAIMLLFIFISSPTSTSLIVLRKQSYSFSLNLLSVIYRPLTIAIGYWYNDFYFGLQLYILCEVLQILLYNGVVLKLLKK